MGQFVIFVLTITILIVRMDYAHEVCRIEKCIEIANEFSKVMNPSIDPCDDFYGYMCGNWNKYHPVSNNDPYRYIDMYSTLDKKMRWQKIDILTNTSISASSEALKKARELFKLCMNVETIKKDEAKSLLDKLKQNGDWLLLNPEPLFSFKINWQKYLKMEYEFVRYNPLFKLTIGISIKRFNFPIIMIEKPILFLSELIKSDDKEKKEGIAAYKEYIHDVASYLRKESGKNNVHRGMNKDIDELIEFELSLAKIIDNKRILLTLEELQIYYNNIGGVHSNAKIDWLETIHLLFKEAGITIPTLQKVLIQDLGYLMHLVQVLKITKSRTIANYIVWNFIRHNIKYSGKTLLSIRKKFNDKVYINGLPEYKRDTTCLMHPNLDKAISLEYINRYFIKSNKDKAQKYIDHILKVFEDGLSKIDWMNSKSRQTSIEKVQAIETLFKLGSDYFESMINFEKFKYFIELAKLQATINRTQWEVEPTVTDAFYKATKNVITVPAAFLQPPVFDPDTPEVFIYSVFGFAMAHEVSHAFDPLGIKCNKEGKVANLWPLPVHEIYKEKADSVKNLYNRYPIPELFIEGQPVHTDGEKTLAENIADLIGLQKAYDAYKDNQRKNGGKDVRLPGFENTTSDELFFMRHALSRCTNITPKNKLCMHQTDCHASPDVRLRGTISNHKDFGDVFGCKPGTPMNPLSSHKCFILT
ncbi:neprilysin-11-like isoform X2 [Prorops nasuta]|uniref:neprilysin-11-like isoform X2 n=1 Tax=Prorops nasuta TaxID=863751 RepID=UPI0034CD8479